jgi:hypothetical protein
MSVVDFLTKKLSENSENVGRRTIEEQEAEISKELSSTEKVFISRYPSLCQAFDTASHGWFVDRGLWLGGYPFAPEGTPSGMVYLIAKRIAGRVINMVGQSGRFAIINSGVFKFSATANDKIALDSCKRNTSCKFILVTIHGDHAHVVHDCPLSRGTCRCFPGFIPKRRTAQRHIISELSQECLSKIIFYCLARQKWIYSIKIGDSSYRCPFSFASQIDRLANSGREESEDAGILESCDSEDRLLSETAGDSDSFFSASSKGARLDKTFKRKREAQSFSDTVYDKLRLILPSPLKGFARTSGWFNDPLLRGFSATKEEVKVAYNRLSFEITNKTLLDFKNMYKVEDEDCDMDEEFHFASLDHDRFNDLYFKKRHSLMWLKKLLIWQYARDSISDNGKVDDIEWKPAVYGFVKYLMELLDKKLGKKNTLYILSPPNSGKTFFADCISHYFLSGGHIKVWNRSSGFPLEELEGARVAFWNEPNFESTNIAEMLKLLGGDTMSIAIKHQASITINKIPIIVTSNYPKFPTTKEFTERIHYQHWTPCDILEPIGNMRLHPYCLDLLFTDCENYFETLIRK